MAKFELIHLPEKDLVFGGNEEDKDPRIGLTNFGPYRYSSETPNLDKIKIGIIGDRSTLEKTKRILTEIQKKIPAKVTNHWLYPDFPGVSPESKFNCSLELNNSWEQTITLHEIETLKKVIDSNERIGKAVELYINKLNMILEEDNLPDVLICSLPADIEDYCGISEKTRGAKTPKPTELEKQVNELKKQNQKFLTEWGIIVDEEKKKERIKGYDFRNALKGKLMSHKSARPIQILRESTADAILNYDSTKKNTRQEPASFAWNFSTALFYKANGKPWRLAKLRDDTCYVGISFYKDKLSFNKDIQTSMAQVFTHTGDGLVLRGTEVYVDEKTKEPHLTEQQAKDLLADAINRYTQRASRNPIRVVIHKKTLFSEAEIKGFSEAIGSLKRDFVALSKRNKGIRFMRAGSYPVLRGTLITLSDKDYILYTSGYTPRIRTYPGHSIPSPLYITHIGDSEIREIGDEILGLTKLNWNTTSFSTYLPITLGFSQRVGQVLSELEKGKQLQNHYKFYM
ncbi:hypothetical protein GF361_00415 [Candidatus Woesearchaeota archaeon]|nr:hypothetical protein [Candidatus Woesearchaeota archaeon]